MRVQTDSNHFHPKPAAAPSPLRQHPARRRVLQTQTSVLAGTSRNATTLGPGAKLAGMVLVTIRVSALRLELADRRRIRTRPRSL